MKEMTEGVNTWRNIPCSPIRSTVMCRERDNAPNLIDGHDIIAPGIPTDFFLEIDKLILKSTWNELRGTRTSQNDPEEERTRTHTFRFQNSLQSFGNKDGGWSWHGINARA